MDEALLQADLCQGANYAESAWQACREAAQATGISKDVGLNLLRHYAASRLCRKC